MRPDIIVRKGNKFIIDEQKILPYMREKKDLVLHAVSIVCKNLKDRPESFSSNPVDKLKELNDNVYAILKQWNVYKD